jgi:transcriptional regulator with XRE-family HTH domain
MRQNFSEEVGEMGRMVRAVRVARGFTQQQVAKGAGVSRAQLADFEKGANVSILFLLKVARFLKFPILSCESGAFSSTPGLDISRVLRLLELVKGAVDELSVAVMEAVLPPSERSSELRDTPALKAFLEKHRADDGALARVAAALVGGTDDRPASREPKPARQPGARMRRTTRKAGV